MGGLFSSEPEVQYRTYTVPRYEYEWESSYIKPEISYSPSRTTIVRPQSSYSTSYSNRSYSSSNVCSSSSCGCEHRERTSTTVSPSFYNANNNISSNKVISSKTTVSKADLKKFQQILCSAVLRQAKVLNWNTTSTSAEYQLIRLDSCSSEFSNIYTRFLKGVVTDAGYIINVMQIERIQNPYLMGQYYLKKLEYQNKRLPVEERILFHGTKSVNIDNICKNNFDWRLHGTTKGNKFGKGVSFTPKSPYANHYCDRNANNKVMLVAKVLVSKACSGHEHMEIPGYYDRSRLLRFDTSIKEPKKDVVVKYTDNEFYPIYKIHYSGKMYYYKNNFSR